MIGHPPRPRGDRVRDCLQLQAPGRSASVGRQVQRPSREAKAERVRGRRATSVDTRPPWAVDGDEVPWGGITPGALPGALTIDLSAMQRRNQSVAQQHRLPPWGVDESPNKHPDSRSLLPDIRGNRGKGRQSPESIPLEGRRVQSRSPAGRQDGKVAGAVSKGSDANSQFRPYMEDRLVVVDPLLSEHGRTWAFFAVYDGHGGAQASEHCSRELHKHLLKELRAKDLSDEAIADSLIRCFKVMDEQLLRLGAHEWGTTATVALAQRAGSSVRLHVANVGDSRALAIDGGRRPVRLSQDHRPSDDGEAIRISREGGFVRMARVGGVLAVSRALGDHAYKNAGVSWRPSISSRDVSHDLGFVIASDGLWDYMQDGEVRDALTADSRDPEISARLVTDAKRRGSTDNICCISVLW